MNPKHEENTCLLSSLSCLKTRVIFPGPFPWPIVGNLSLFKRLVRELGTQHLAFLELSKRYNSGTISLHLGGSRLIVVSGNKSLDRLFRCEDFDGRPWNEFIKLRNLGQKQGNEI